jgi:hypothetical protein
MEGYKEILEVALNRWPETKILKAKITETEILVYWIVLTFYYSK